jgi:hypothetical protein
MHITTSSGFAVAPGLKGHNARGPLKVQPKLHSQRLGIWQAEIPGCAGGPAGSCRGFTSVGANRLEASVQGPWISSGLHTRQGF